MNVRMVIFAALATSVYVPGWSNPSSAPKWFVLAFAPLFLRGQSSTWAHWLGVAFIAWCAFTIAWDPAPFDGIGAFFVLCFWAALFLLGNEMPDLRPIFIGGSIGLGVSSIFAVLQFFHVYLFRTNSPIAGLYVNGNYMAEAAALVLIGLVAEKLWWFIPPILPALILPQGRTAWLAAGVGLSVHYRRYWKITAPIAVLALGGLIWLSIPKGDGGNVSTIERIAIWRSAASGVTFAGHGVGSFWTQFPIFDQRIDKHGTTPEQAHNEFLTIAFETGIPGLALAIAFCLMLIGPLNTTRVILIGLLVEMCFAFPLRLPATAFLGLVAAGHAVRDAHLLRRHALRGGRDRPAWFAFARYAPGIADAYLGQSRHAV